MGGKIMTETGYVKLLNEVATYFDCEQRRANN